MKKFDLKKFLLTNFPYFIIFYVVDKTVWLFRHCVADTLIDKVSVLFANYGLAFSNFGFMGNAVVSSLFADIFLNI